eukprot:g13520.t1
MSSYFKDRNFPPSVVENAPDRISCVSRTSGLTSPPRNKSKDRMPLILTPTMPSTFPCNRRKCYTCPYTSPLTSIQGTKQTFHIRQRFTCTSVNVVY